MKFTLKFSPLRFDCDIRNATERIDRRTWFHALALCLIASLTTQCDATEKSEHTVTTHTGYVVELIAVGDGSGKWWSPTGAPLESLPVNVDLRDGEAGSGESDSVRDVLMAVRKPSKTAAGVANELLPSVWVSGAEVVSTLDTEPAWSGDIGYVVRRAHLSRGTQGLEITIDAPTSPWVVEASIKATPDGFQPAEPLIGTLDDSNGVVAYRMSIHSTLPEDVRSDDRAMPFIEFVPQYDKLVSAPGGRPAPFKEKTIEGANIVSRYGESLTANSIAYVVLDPTDDMTFADEYQLRGVYGAMGVYHPSGFRRGLISGYVALRFDRSDNSTGQSASDRRALLVQEFGATGTIEGGGFNAPVVYGLRKPVTFELRRRPYETLTMAKFATTPEAQ